MSRRYRFDLSSNDPGRLLPEKVIVGVKSDETEIHVVLKALGFVICYRDRMEIEKRIPRDDVLYVPDLIQLDYQLEAAFWGECGECGLDKLDKLAVKVPRADITIIKKSLNEATELLHKMEKAKLRKGRYTILAFNVDDFTELLNLLEMKNSVFLCSVDFEVSPAQVQFEFNGLWFDIQLHVLKF